MAPPSQSEVERQLASLQAEFKRTLPDKVSEIESLWNSIVTSEGNNTALVDCHRMAHTLVGSGGTFGAVVVTTASRKLEQALKPLVKEINLSAENQSNISGLILELKMVADNWQPSKIPYLKPLAEKEKEKEKRKNNLIYLAEDDELLAANMVNQLEQDNFIVKYFPALDAFATAFAEEMPAAIIMDIMFKEGSIAGIESIEQLKKNCDTFPPFIVISVRDDMEARLAAVNAGAQRYFTKPVNTQKLSHTLDGLIERTVADPYRILFVDDDTSLLKYYETVVLGAGMEVKTISNPMNCLAALEDFNPDVIVLDVYMPECSGPELAKVIKQDDHWALTPLMFLSTETDLEIQLEILDIGGESFMVKPIEASHLISTVTAKAKRSRWSHRLNDDLKTTLRESQYQLITFNEHNIVSTADVSGKITSVNDKFCVISGYSRSELIGQNHRLLKSNRHPESFYKDMWKTISSGQVWQGTICNFNKDGKEYWVESTMVPFLNEKGKPYKYVSARTDVTSVIESEERLERSQEFAKIGTWDWNIESGLLFWSDQIWPLFGYDKKVTETTYENFMAAIHPEDQKSVSDAVALCVEKGIEYNIEHRVVWPDKSIHWLHESGDVVRGIEGKPLHMLGVVQDITNRKASEEALLNSEQQLRQAQTLARIGNWQADIRTGKLTWSDEIYKIFGFEPGEFKPSVEAFHAAVHPDDIEKVLESEKRAEQTGSHDVVHRIVLPDGSVNHVHELAHAETDADGQLLRMSGTVQDITELVAAKTKQRETEEQLVLAVESAGDGVWDWDIRTNFMNYSQLAMEMLGYEEDEFPYHLNTWINLVHPDDIAEVTHNLKNYLSHYQKNYLKEHKLPYVMEQRIRCKDGSYKWILSRGTVVEHNKKGRPLRMIGIHTDITEQKDTEQSLIQARKDAEDANRAKSQFLSSMSHELRTPMNAIMGFGQLLTLDIGSPLNASQSENVNEILKASDHLLELINEVLDLAKIEAGRIDLSIEDVILSDVISESLQLILPLADKRGISIDLYREGTEVDINNLLEFKNTVRADYTRLKQVIINLLSNAVKYNSKKGNITIKCSDLNESVRISVTDTGAGLNQKQQEQLFTAFNRLGAENTEIEGTGIGLVISQNIIQLMGGEIGVESKPGVGSTFWFELVSSSAANNETDKDTSPDDVEVILESKRNVLYIEDNPANLRLVTQLLGRLPNLHMWTAHEPMLGLELAEEHKPDLILLDINLPGMDGFEVLSLLKQRLATKNTPVIAISANAMPKDIEKGLKAGFDEYITKPININELLVAVDDKLNN